MTDMMELCQEVNKAWDEQKTEQRISLKILMNRSGTDKFFTHHYDEEYARHFESLRDKTLTLLEIGVGGYGSPKRGGDSLKVWRDYFEFATIVGLDNETKNLKLGDRVTICRGSQSDAECLTSLNSERGPFDIIIDDGSHRPEDQFTSFTTLFPLMKPGGIYVIEDLETSYRPAYGGDPNAPQTIGLIQRLIDGLHWQFWSGRGPTGIDQMVKSIHVSKELAFIYRH
jgi:8-demethyl-8-alpha-L-rhamnosyltetracenomycin-C 2'-O-methyltransferase